MGALLAIGVLIVPSVPRVDPTGHVITLTVHARVMTPASVVLIVVLALALVYSVMTVCLCRVLSHSLLRLAPILVVLS